MAGALIIGLNILQGLLLIGLGPLVLGVLTAAHRRWQGRAAPSLLQPYRTMIARYRLPAIRSKDSSNISDRLPLVLLLLYGSLAFVVPPVGPAGLDVIAGWGIGSPANADLFLIAFLLASGRFLVALVGLDSGSGFGGFGASRLAFLQVLTEPGLVVSALIVSYPASRDYPYGVAALALSLVALGLLFLGEIEWLPIANPDTHKELTAIIEAILVKLAGRDLADVTWAEMTKLSALLCILVVLAGQLMGAIVVRLSALAGDWIGPAVSVLLLVLAVPVVRLFPQVPRWAPRGVQMHYTVAWVAAFAAIVAPPLLWLGAQR